TGVYVTATGHGSRSHARAFEVRLEGNGGHRNSGAYGAQTDEQAATWDEWGIFLARLYAIDPEMVCGTIKRPIYRNAEHYHWTTGKRFTWLTHGGQHARHRWVFGEADKVARTSRASCKCGAVKRWEW